MDEFILEAERGNWEEKHMNNLPFCEVAFFEENMSNILPTLIPNSPFVFWTDTLSYFYANLWLCEICF